jgi:hypothetical protein
MRAIPPTLKVSLSFGRSRAHDHADASHPLGLLRARRERPRDGNAAHERDEFASPHSITSSARASGAISAEFWVAT